MKEAFAAGTWGSRSSLNSKLRGALNCTGYRAMHRSNIDDPDLTLTSLFELWPETPAVFLRRRMLCFGCPIAPFHTVIDACREYGLDEQAFRAELRAAVRQPGQ
ncbi:DUF1858 domain-containing protein [Roseibium sp.]|uniref:DUF1858 domain-containing protein n=2 Tax=Roseibium sp. TaxID=1936156 RepID=UPI00326369F5